MYRILPLSMPLNDPQSEFQGHAIIQRVCLLTVCVCHKRNMAGVYSNDRVLDARSRPRGQICMAMCTWRHVMWSHFRLLASGLRFTFVSPLTLFFSVAFCEQWSEVNVYLYSASPRSASNALPLPVRRRWSPQGSPTARQSANSVRPRIRCITLYAYMFTAPTFIGYSL